MTEPWLWLDTIVKGDGVDDLSKFILLARAWYIDHETIRGFKYPPDMVDAPWWAGLVPPFSCYSRPEMERFIAIFDSEMDATPTFRTVTYEMKVSEFSLSGLRFKVYDAPEIWVLAWQTQSKP